MRFFRLALALTIIFLLTILTSRFVGATQANPIAVLFTNPDGSPCQMPCLFGVRPGETTLDEGLQILDKHPLTHGMSRKNLSDGVTLHSQEVFIDLWASENNLIIKVSLDFEANPDQITTPRLALAMQQALPGNQALHFGTPQPDMFKNIRQPSVTQRCYLGYTICFNNKQGEIVHPWQLEPFYNLQVLSHASN
jgi:hypothetical protein